MCFLSNFAFLLRNVCHYKLAYTETLKIKMIIFQIKMKTREGFFAAIRVLAV